MIVTRAQRDAAVVLWGRRCYLCWKPIERHIWGDLHIDHVWPRRFGGCDCWANLRPAHQSCNQVKGTRRAWRICPWHGSVAIPNVGERLDGIFRWRQAYERNDQWFVVASQYHLRAGTRTSPVRIETAINNGTYAGWGLTPERAERDLLMRAHLGWVGYGVPQLSQWRPITKERWRQGTWALFEATA